jgi:hypothetical protein
VSNPENRLAAMDRNKHITDYLAYYISFPHPPRFAVLLNGPWGIGKTFLLKSFLNALGNGEKSYVYVSLYGLASVDDIDDALFRAMYPVLDMKGVKLAGRAAKAAAKFFRVDIELTAKDILKRSAAELLYSMTWSAARLQSIRYWAISTSSLSMKAARLLL